MRLVEQVTLAFLLTIAPQLRLDSEKVDSALEDIGAYFVNGK